MEYVGPSFGLYLFEIEFQLLLDSMDGHANDFKDFLWNNMHKDNASPSVYIHLLLHCYYNM